MGRKPIDEEQKRIFVGIRLPQWLLNRIRKDGTPQQVIEETLHKKYEEKKG